MTDFSEESLPISEEPTRDFSGISGSEADFCDFDGFDLSANLKATKNDFGDTPKRIGDYELRGLIGSGGMGNVYLAEHVRMQRIVAIKMLPIERMDNEDAVARFYAEVRAASRLLHPNIVAAFDAGEVESEEFGVVHFLAMEYVDGMTLTQVISGSGPMSVGEAAATIRQAALGLLHAHRSGIVHRDVKPGNLMRSKDGTVKVLDLGLAQMQNVALNSNSDPQEPSDPESKSATRGRLIGTLPFMSPEQLEDPDNVDSRSDIYSLGATLYFLLTANPPFTGEYLDQVYGHRHGEIPDLMQARDDVDLNFANIFSRMMAKSPDQRYASLDEVIDDLGNYASESDTPNWLAEFAQRQSRPDLSTVSGGSTSGATATVLGIDFGMQYASIAVSSPDGTITSLAPGRDGHRLFRMAIASNPGLVFDADAMDLRARSPQAMVHCVHMYIGNKLVNRSVASRQCPPEVLLAMLMKRMLSDSSYKGPAPHATAITVPSSYDQLHRRSISQAAELAGFSSVRIVDRSIAAVQSLSISESTVEPSTTADQESPSNDSEPRLTVSQDKNETILFISVTGSATEVALIRRSALRLQQLSTAGHWLQGSLPWLQRLVDIAAELIKEQTGVNPKKSIHSATQLQIECEKAMNAMLLMTSTSIAITMKGKPVSVTVDRSVWLASCLDLMEAVGQAIETCCKEASVDPSEIDLCASLGALLRIKQVRERVLPEAIQDIEMQSIDRADVARGAAACLASELPGRSDIMMPPRTVTSHSIGILVEDAKGRRRILPIIPKGTLLPARTNRRLTASSKRESMTVSLVESAGVKDDNWQTLGRYDLDVGSGAGDQRTRTIGFEVNVNGLLTVRAPMPVSSTKSNTASVHASTKLSPLPEPNLSAQEISEWKTWIDKTMDV
ncbi:Serine/threonine-protein kinase PknB [Rubripirellula amarantea]|uniref:Serine/threonine-protein kinase PknB n=1 Tax=Rubripirellula amarantea TaxID=2527999 RepID=A0A5C5WKV8_9BACT|nr:Hsp70 family protein [Rubripirellula amarantea]TWT51257.1 Serine/threonine-protein kinase PknB [Rubripirellula amarantea]